jgi:copper chaperone NosL
MKLNLVILGLALLGATACSVRAEGPPEIVVDRSVCSHCGMLISEPLYAAAYQAPGGPARLFDDIGCLLAAVRSEPGRPLRFWFNDAAQGGWIEGRESVFVASAEFRTPMGGGLIAYRGQAAAGPAAGRSNGEVVGSLEELLRRKGGKS